MITLREGLVVPTVKPEPPIEEPHWKVGDGMDDEGDRYIIGNIAVVQLDEHVFEIRYYDEKGKLRGDQRMELLRDL